MVANSVVKPIEKSKNPHVCLPLGTSELSLPTSNQMQESFMLLLAGCQLQANCADALLLVKNKCTATPSTNTLHVKGEGNLEYDGKVNIIPGAACRAL